MRLGVFMASVLLAFDSGWICGYEDRPISGIDATLHFACAALRVLSAAKLRLRPPWLDG
jgi:hypothetical protein